MQKCPGVTVKLNLKGNELVQSFCAADNNPAVAEEPHFERLLAPARIGRAGVREAKQGSAAVLQECPQCTQQG